MYGSGEKGQPLMEELEKTKPLRCRTFCWAAKHQTCHFLRSPRQQSVNTKMFPGPFSVYPSLLQSLYLLIRQLRDFRLRLGRRLPLGFWCLQIAKGWDHSQEFGFAFVWGTAWTFPPHDSRHLGHSFPFKACYRKASHHSLNKAESGLTAEPGRSFKAPSSILGSGEFIPDLALSQPAAGSCWSSESYFFSFVSVLFFHLDVFTCL